MKELAQNGLHLTWNPRILNLELLITKDRRAMGIEMCNELADRLIESGIDRDQIAL